jgi:nickel-type superoxide dismutase maturation protease
MGNRQLETYQVSGNSMYPLLRDGQEVQVQPADDYQVGDIVVARHPIQSDLTIVKRIDEISSDGRFRLRGSNSEESTDHFGLISPNKIIGKIFDKLH